MWMYLSSYEWSFVRRSGPCIVRHIVQRAYWFSYMIVILEIFLHPESNYEIYNSFKTFIIIKKAFKKKREKY